MQQKKPVSTGCHWLTVPCGETLSFGNVQAKHVTVSASLGMDVKIGLIIAQTLLETCFNLSFSHTSFQYEPLSATLATNPHPVLVFVHMPLTLIRSQRV
ncbi:hypothetical protein JQC72_09210 [Polycladomyces sp. WAk]|uniref:Uncharacterized protein n=1 Tax=Polycladomyces zharkentensis TaxID=2807616 RepID=A0ABS2WK83_9BACL|nr:hypothetical protein [Polycladomyces sp. WAk]MBN2909705.1 hypothetical protein [Polycladomyces sp. WAk]